MVSLDSTKVTGVNCGNTISDFYYPCQKMLMLSMCCLNKTITTLNQSVMIADFVKFTFLDFDQCTIMFTPLKGQSLLLHIYYLLIEKVITGKSQNEASMYLLQI